MPNKSLNPSPSANRTSAQRPCQPTTQTSFESATVTVGAGESLNVEGVAYAFVYGATAVQCHDVPNPVGAVALEDSTGTAVTVTTARLVDVRGVRYVRFVGACTVVVTG